MLCRIGQNERCDAIGCEWRKAFGNSCPAEQVTALKFVPAEDTKPFYTRRRKKGRVVKEEKKYTEIKPLINNPVSVKKEKEIDFTKITTAKQDDWIAKIKSV